MRQLDKLALLLFSPDRHRGDGGGGRSRSGPILGGRLSPRNWLFVIADLDLTKARDAAAELGSHVAAPPAYWRAPPHEQKDLFGATTFGAR